MRRSPKPAPAPPPPGGRRMVAGVLAAAVTILVGCSSAADNSTGPSGPSGTDSATSSSSTTSSAATPDTTSTSGTASTDGTPSGSVAASGGESGSSSPAAPTPGSSGDPAAAATPIAPTGDQAAAAPTEAGDEAPPFTGNPSALPLTAPGTMLKITDPATVPFSYSFNDAVVTFSALSLTAGTVDDWAPLGSDSGAADGDVPWYLRVTITQVAGGDISNGYLDENLQAYTSANDPVQTTFDIDPANSLCPKSAADQNFTVGSSYTSCVVLLAASGEKIDKVTYEGGDAFQTYFDNPIVWSAG